MKNMRKLSARLRDKRGTVVVVVVLFLVLLLGFAALAVDVGYMMVRRNELQNIADTAALAGAGQLFTDYTAITTADPLLSTPSPGPLLAAARAVASSTGVSGVTISPADFRLGVWNSTTHTFTPQAIGPSAVNVTAHKDNVENGPFSTFLAGILGRSSFNVATTATASLTPPLSVDNLPIPVGISWAWYKNDWGEAGYCNQKIKFYPTGTMEGCAGWHGYTNDPPKIKDTLGGLIDGTFTSPMTIAGETTYNFTNGNVADAVANPNPRTPTLKKLYDMNKVPDTDGRCLAQFPSYGGYSWTAAVAVYAPIRPTLQESLDDADCGAPNQAQLIVGFSTVTICAVLGPPDSPPGTQEIDAIVDCNRMSSSSGGGPVPTGTWSTPHLVQ